MNRTEALTHVAQLTTSDRNRTHGNPIDQFERAQAIKRAVGHQELIHQDNSPINEVECESLDFICSKISRLVSGNKAAVPVEKWADHWLDIIGYAAIAVESLYNKPLLTQSSNLGTYISEGAEEEEQASAAAIARKFAPRT